MQLAGLLAGKRLDPFQIARLCHSEGWRDEKLLIAVAVVMAESAGYTEATNENTNGSIDRGLWQINSLHVDAGRISAEECFDPVASTEYAYSLYKARSYSFGAWAAFNNGAYKTKMKDATRGVANYWRTIYEITPFLKEQP